MDIAGFVMWVIQNSAWQGVDLDGADAQEKALDCGIIERVSYDPMIHGGGNVVEANPGDEWYVFSEAFKEFCK